MILQSAVKDAVQCSNSSCPAAQFSVNTARSFDMVMFYGKVETMHWAGAAYHRLFTTLQSIVTLSTQPIISSLCNSMVCKAEYVNKSKNLHPEGQRSISRLKRRNIIIVTVNQKCVIGR